MPRARINYPLDPKTGPSTPPMVCKAEIRQEYRWSKGLEPSLFKEGMQFRHHVPQYSVSGWVRIYCI